MPCNINNNTSHDLSELEDLIKQFIPFAQERIGFNKPPTINFMSDEENAVNPLGKTGQYDIQNMEITIFVDGRHTKDILRSISHELVHHGQNCRGEFKHSVSTDVGYAQNDDFLRGMEDEAYREGNFCLRDWEDGIKMENKPLHETIYRETLVGGENIMSLKEWKDQELNDLLMDKWGFKKPATTKPTKKNLQKLNEEVDAFMDIKVGWSSTQNQLQEEDDDEIEEGVTTFEEDQIPAQAVEARQLDEDDEEARIYEEIRKTFKSFFLTEFVNNTGKKKGFDPLTFLGTALTDENAPIYASVEELVSDNFSKQFGTIPTLPQKKEMVEKITAALTAPTTALAAPTAIAENKSLLSEAAPPTFAQGYQAAKEAIRKLWPAWKGMLESNAKKITKYTDELAENHGKMGRIWADRTLDNVAATEALSALAKRNYALLERIDKQLAKMSTQWADDVVQLNLTPAQKRAAQKVIDAMDPQKALMVTKAEITANMGKVTTPERFLNWFRENVGAHLPPDFWAAGAGKESGHKLAAYWGGKTFSPAQRAGTASPGLVKPTMVADEGLEALLVGPGNGWWAKSWPTAADPLGVAAAPRVGAEAAQATGHYLSKIKTAVEDAVGGYYAAGQAFFTPGRAQQADRLFWPQKYFAGAGGRGMYGSLDHLFDAVAKMDWKAGVTKAWLSESKHRFKRLWRKLLPFFLGVPGATRGAVSKLVHMGKEIPVQVNTYASLIGQFLKLHFLLARAANKLPWWGGKFPLAPMAFFVEYAWYRNSFLYYWIWDALHEIRLNPETNEALKGAVTAILLLDIVIMWMSKLSHEYIGIAFELIQHPSVGKAFECLRLIARARADTYLNMDLAQKEYDKIENPTEEEFNKFQDKLRLIQLAYRCSTSEPVMKLTPKPKRAPRMTDPGVNAPEGAGGVHLPGDPMPQPLPPAQVATDLTVVGPLKTRCPAGFEDRTVGCDAYTWQSVKDAIERSFHSLKEKMAEVGVELGEGIMEKVDEKFDAMWREVDVRLGALGVDVSKWQKKKGEEVTTAMTGAIKTGTKAVQDTTARVQQSALGCVKDARNGTKPHNLCKMIGLACSPITDWKCFAAGVTGGSAKTMKFTKLAGATWVLHGNGALTRNTGRATPAEKTTFIDAFLAKKEADIKAGKIVNALTK